MIAWRRLVSALLLGLVFAVGLAPAGASEAQTATGSAASPASDATRQERIRELLTLLAQQWLEEQGAIKPAASAPSDNGSTLVIEYLNSWATDVHDQIIGFTRAIPRLPEEFKNAAKNIAGIQWGDRLWYFIILGVVVAGAEWLIRAVNSRISRRLDDLPSETVAGRLYLIVARFGLRLGAIAGFVVASVGLFLALDFPPIRRATILGVIIAVATIRLAVALGDALFAPDREDLRVIPMATTAACFWRRRLNALASWFATVWVIVQECLTLGFSQSGTEVIGYSLGLGVVAIALEAVWRRPEALVERNNSAAVTRQFLRTACKAALSLGVVLLWILWVAAPGVTRVRPSFWLVLVVMVLPFAIRTSRLAVVHLLRPANPSQIDAGASVMRVALEHGIRALLIIGAVGVLSYGWELDLVHFAGRDTFFARLVRGILTTVVTSLLADVLWQVLRAVIESKLAATADLGQPNTEEARRRARLHTLLPIFRNVSLIVVVVVATMMALAELGIQIGPLVAGASVIGVAIGFGAQTFVRDVIAGMFYLLDDAFRVGEYIQSNNYKGTVEGFSIRSVRLRHHRGPVYTVPFSLLGAIQNQSRDWVIDKMTVGITYDSDLEKARKLIKQVGQQLAEDPEFAPLIIEPLKMQGVEEFSEFAIKIRLKMMTLPGEQFVIRRKAYAMIKKTFDENGIKFALPTVQVASDAEPIDAAAARQSLELAHTAAG